jgi:50S ribosomal subunit-associated GTPase HflX
VLLPGTSPEVVRDQMAELADLARTAGAEIVGSDVQRRSEIDPAHFIGMGKVEELRDMKLEGAFDVVICNEDLSPRQQRNLELNVKARVLDRTEIILEIFACCQDLSARMPMTVRSVGGAAELERAVVLVSSRSRSRGVASAGACAM